CPRAAGTCGREQKSVLYRSLRPLRDAKGLTMMDRRSLLKSLAAGVGATLFSVRQSAAALPKARITRVKCWAHPSMNRSFNQSALLVTVETDIGITGIG